jgi:phage-related protein
VVWTGDSKKQLKKMPEDVQKQMGGELYLAQRGEDPPHSKMLKGLGSGIFEIRDDFDSNTYRRCMPSRSASGCMYCMRFRRKVKGASRHPERCGVNYAAV